MSVSVTVSSLHPIFWSVIDEITELLASIVAVKEGQEKVVEKQLMRAWYRGETHYNYNFLASTRRGVISDKKTISASCLDFEAIWSPSSTSLLELSALLSLLHAWLDSIVCVRVCDRGLVTKVSVGFTIALSTSQQDGVRALGGAKGELIKSDAFTAGLDNSSSSRLSETKCGNCKKRDFQKTSVISHGSDNDGSLVILWLHEAR